MIYNNDTVYTGTKTKEIENYTPDIYICEKINETNLIQPAGKKNKKNTELTHTQNKTQDSKPK